MKWRGWREHGWLVFLAATSAASVACAFLQSFVADAILAQALGWAAVAIGIVTARRSTGLVRLTWLSFAGASAAVMVAAVVRTVHGLIIDVEKPLPSPADILLVSGHLCLITGSILLGHLRSPDRNRAAIIDGALIAAGAGTMVWATLLWPYVTDSSVPVAARALNGFYALLTTTLVASLARLAVGPGARTLSYRLMAGAVVFIVAQDLAVTIEYVGGPDARLGRALTPFIFVLFGTAVLHPDLDRITEAADSYQVRLTWQRVLLLVGALLMNPAVIALQLIRGWQPTPVVTTVSSIVISLLVLTRLGYLLRSQERATAQEQALRRANAELAVAPDRSTMLEASLRAVDELADHTPGLRASVVMADGDDLAVLASIGVRADEAGGRRVPLASLPSWVTDGLLDARDPVEHVGPPIDVAPAPGDPPVTVYAVALSSPSTARGALVVTTSETLPLVNRQAIDALATTTSLALESAALAEDLQRSRIERRFRALVENSSDLIVVIDADRRITFVSSASRRLLGRDEESLLGAAPQRLPQDEDVALFDSLLDEADVSEFTHPVEIRLWHADGAPRWFEIAARDLRHDPEIQGFVLNCREVSDRKDAELRLFRSEARFRALVQNVSDVVAVIDDWGRFTYVSPAVTPLLGYRAEQLLDTPATAIVAADQQGEAQNLLLSALRDTGAATSSQSIELRALALDGTIRTLDVTVSDLRHDPAVHGIVLNARDITIRKQLEYTLRHQAHHDALTGLANRTRFADLVDVAVHEGQHAACVLFIDLDDFKTVNDSLGHAAGDELLIAVAERLSASLPSDATPARLGGDEFAVLVRPVDDDLGPVGVALRLLHELRAPFDINGLEIVVTASIGIAAVGGDDHTAEVVLRNADMAMYLAKERGKDRVELFEEAMHATAFERLELKADLARAITAGQLALVYQPVVSLETGRITGAEALVRWDHPRRGRLGPDSFIAIAEETGLIVQLGQWVLEEACQQLRSWQLTLPADAALSMSVNLSVRQLEQASIVDAVRDAVDQFGLDPTTLTLEITETVIIDHMEADRSRLTALKALGVQIALDDFGVGYSSLRYVDDLPVDVLKVDRSFVGGITGEEATPVLDAIVALGRRLGVHTTAEGIETPQQLNVLRSIGCDLGQGYLFSPPIAPDAFARLLARNLAQGGFDMPARGGHDVGQPGERPDHHT